MVKLVKLLGLFVGKMYNRQARLLVIEAKAAKVLSDATSAKAAKLVSRAKELEETKESKLEESARVALQAQTITKFFK
ncbi:hypothetical protein [Yersinia phage fPS-59]|uniref:Uncharacterized protein n=1 Tax=Yersinia phage fPS-59 TaxID=2052754 RepID=A0A2D0PEC6_9CAUD|nr:hypothetical protein HOS89_gp18 [Yersinia phage fPS-59]SOO46806.1 hypothetical protein [Yersinia phage fPS-59]